MALQTIYALIVGACCVLYFIIAKIASSIENYRFSNANGCKPAPKYPQFERILGIANFREDKAHAKAKIRLQSGYKKFEQFGNTYSTFEMGLTLHHTIEPNNIKTILSSKFKDYGLGGRIDAMGALLGRGIFTSDGVDWEHSRVRGLHFPQNASLTSPGYGSSQLHEESSR